MSTDLTAHDVLCAAKTYLMKHGWMQSGYGDHGGPRCCLGAIGSACGVHDLDHDWLLPMVEAIGEVIDVIDHAGYEGIPDWNDASERTFDDVVAALDQAIIATAPIEARISELVA